jgi:hypothetical protein
MALSIGNGSAWKNVTNIKVGSGSVWKQAQSVWVGVGGVWKKAWDYLNADAIPLSASDFDGLQGPVSASCLYSTDGNCYTIEGGAAAVNRGAWLLVGSTSDFQIRVTGTGDTPIGDSLNTWLALTSTRSWGFSLPGQGTRSFTGTAELRRTSDQVVVDSASINIQVESTL